MRLKGVSNQRFHFLIGIRGILPTRINFCKIFMILSSSSVRIKGIVLRRWSILPFPSTNSLIRSLSSCLDPIYFAFASANIDSDIGRILRAQLFFHDLPCIIVYLLCFRIGEKLVSLLQQVKLYDISRRARPIGVVIHHEFAIIFFHWNIVNFWLNLSLNVDSSLSYHLL